MAIIESPFPDVHIPQRNILTYLFPNDALVTDEIIWQQANSWEMAMSLRKSLQCIKRLGSGLNKLGLRAGDVVFICTPNHVYVPIAYLGVVGSTFIFSGANPTYTAIEIAHQINNVGAKVILVHPSKVEAVLEAAKKLNFPKDHIFQFSEVVMAPRDGILDWTAILTSAEEAEGWHWPELTPEQARSTIATVNYSSGTTGLPKGVRISHANLIANLEQSNFINYVGCEHKRGIKETNVAFLPLYHAYGQLFTILIPIVRQTRVYIMSEFNLELYLDLIQRTRPTTLQLVPPILVLLTKRPEVKDYDLSSVETIISGAAPLSRELQKNIRDRFNVNVKQGWGMTEVTCSGITCAGDDVDETGSVGVLLPNMQARLLDDSGMDAAPGEPGELYLRGPQVCLGYWRNEEASKELLDPDGWLKTGDVAKYEASTRRFWIVDRKKELIKVNGMQVAPAELEAALLENKHVADAAVVGVTVHGMEAARAYVVLQPAAKGKVLPRDIQDWLADRLSKHKHLRGGVVYVDELPKLPSGKIVRKLMREWANRDSAELEKGPGIAKM